MQEGSVSSGKINLYWLLDMVNPIATHIFRVNGNLFKVGFRKY
jgi:hypothetical protein